MLVASRVVPLALVLAIATPVAAEVACTGPDDLCTGDPCIIPTLTVADTCVVDFGPRAVIVAGNLTGGPNALSLTAASITVEGAIRAGSLGTAAPDITLLATAGDITLNGPLASPARVAYAGGAIILLEAAGNLVANAPIKVGGYYPRLTIHAGGDVMLLKRVASLQYTTVEAGGAITVGGRLWGGGTTLDAGDTLTLDNVTQIAIATLRGANGVTVRRPIFSYFLDIASSAGDVNLEASIVSYGSTDVSVTAAGTARVNRTITFSAPGSNHAGALSVVAGSVEVGPLARIFAPVPGGSFQLAATAGDLTLAGRFSAPSGTIEGTATNDLTATGRFEVGTGCIGLSAGGVLDTSGATFDVPVVPDCP